MGTFKGNDRNVRERISRHIMEITIRTPSLSTPLVILPIELDNACPHAMGISPKMIVYNENKLQGCGENTLRYILLHESVHYVQRAPFRIMRYIRDNKAEWDQEDAIRMNWALDLSANDLLDRAGIPRPDPEDTFLQPLIPGEPPFQDFPKGQEVEFYYELLREMEEKQRKEQEQNEQQDKQDKGGDKEEGDSGDSRQGSEENEESDSGEAEGAEGQDGSDSPDEEGEGEEQGEGSGDDGDDSPADKKRSKDKRGAGRNGSKREGEREGSDGGDSEEGEKGENVGSGVADDGRPLTDLELYQLIEQMKNFAMDVIPADPEDPETAEKQVEASAVLSQMTADIGTWSNKADQMFKDFIVKELQPPKIPWQRQLRMLMTKNENSKPSYARPNRRRNGGSLLFPSRFNKTLGDTALVCDSSGSMASFIQAVASECHSIVNTFPNSVLHVIVGDAIIRKEEKFGKGQIVMNPADWKFPGGQGTDMSPMFARAVELKVNAIICMTDLFMVFPPQPPVPVIWVVPEVLKPYITNYPNYGSVVWITK